MDKETTPIPTTGATDFIDIASIPRYFEVFGVNKCHVVLSETINDNSPYIESKGICGRECTGSVMQKNIPYDRLCKDCRGKLEDRMEDCMYDDENDEYYDPRREQYER